MADAQIRGGDVDGALASATRGRSLIEDDGSPDDLAMAAWVLARATLPHDRGKAIAFGKEARAAYARANDATKEAEVDHWLGINRAVGTVE